MLIETIQLFEYENRFHEPIQVCYRNFTNRAPKGFELMNMFERLYRILYKCSKMGIEPMNMFEECKVKSIFMLKIVK